MLTGCGKPAPSESAAPAKSAAPAAADPFGKYDTPVTVTAVKSVGSGTMEFAPGDDINNNVWTRKFKEDLNIDVKYKWTTNDAQYGQKLNIAITSNDLPDLMTVTNTQLKMMVDNGQAMDVTKVVGDYAAPFTKKTLADDGGAALKSATFDGKLMAIPFTQAGLQSAPVLWVRTDWLKKLGLKAPTTAEELLAVADAFTNKDPDGDGKKDTFGLAINKDLFGTGFASLEGFFNGYNAYPNIWLNKDGALAYGSVQPEMKTAVGVLRDMYKKGLLDPEFGVKDSNKVNEDVSAGKFGLMFGGFWNIAWVNAMKVDHPEIEWTPIALPGQGGPASAQIPFGTTYYYVINANCKHPEAVVKLINLQLEKGYGETAEPTKYNITPEGYGPYNYPPAVLEPPMKNFEAAEKVSAAITAKDPSKLNLEQKGYYDMAMLSLEGKNENNNYHQLKMYGPNGSLTVMKGYLDTNHVVADSFYGAPGEAMTEKLTTLQKEQLSDFTAIILGSKDLNSFAEFVKNWNNLGGADMTTEVNKWFKGQK
jgi:putative aldouronate transport system substrate-binding protein